MKKEWNEQMTESDDPIILRAEQMCFSYEDGTNALKGVDLQIRKGKKVALLGANGSGKSTFFLCLNGIHKPSSGQLYFHEKPLDYSKKGLLNLRSKIGIVFQDPDNQLFLANVLQEISFGILNMGITTEEAKQRVDQVMDDLMIRAFCDKPTHALSGGQKKQVSVADVLVMNPEVVILDEPAASLDPLHVKLVNQMVEKMTKRGITVLISTHDVDFAYRWADEIVLFYEGEVLAHGTPGEVFSQVNLLKKTHLTQPVVLKLFYSLRKKELLPAGLSLPRTLEELESHIQGVKGQTYYGRGKQVGDGKRAILMVSFGTSHEDARKKNIDAIEADIRKAYPEDEIYTAWTSGIIIKRIWERDGYKVDNVTEAMDRITAAGIKELIVQPTHVINGIENDRMKEDVLRFQDRLESISFGTPLLTCEEDSKEVIDTLMGALASLDSDTALVFMGHGTTHFANTIYAALDYQFKDRGYPNVYVGTVEAYPSMETLKRLVKEGNYRKIVLSPFMIVAGEHARHDMASEDEDSWKCQFEREGYEVSCVMKGLGEYEGIRNLFLMHIKCAGE